MRGQTLAEKILSHAAGKAVRAGDLVVVDCALVMIVDSVAQSVIKTLTKELGVTKFPHPERITFVIDHVAPAPTVQVAEGQAELRRYARQHNLQVFEVGRGICHQVMVEEGLTPPGKIALGSDSHTNTYGAVCCFGTGMGATDVALAAASGKTWLRVPETIRIDVSGRFRPGAGPKDLALEMESQLRADGATYRSVEYHCLDWLPLSGRMTLANMTTELGAKCGLVAPGGEVAKRYVPPPWLTVDQDASYLRRLSVSLDTLTPRVAAPYTVDNVSGVENFKDVKVDMVFLGTCTNARQDDLEAAARILKGHTLAPGVRMLVIPASSQVLQDAISNGSLATLLAAGATISTPGCGPCIGRHQGVLAAGEVCVSTGNRNFLGRMGSPEAKVYLASPEVAAASAVLGRIASPEEVL